MNGAKLGKGLTTVVVLIYAFILLPLLLVVPISFNAGSGFDLPPRGLSLRWYETLWKSEPFRHAMLNVSLLAALVTAMVATVLGTLTAIAITRCTFRGRSFLEAVFMTPLIAPHILLGAALYLYFTRLGIAGSLLSLILGHVLIATPYVIRSVTAGLAGLEPQIEEAAVNLGAGRVRAFFLVVVPRIKSSLISGAIFAFIVSFSDVNVALFLSGPGTTTLPVHLFTQIQWDSDPSIAAASTVQILLIALLIVLLQRIFRIRIAM
ncbi:MAG: ABC transporter permease [Alphaproteobacteria bacterium]|nr:ABC transporter permease [Alphaproteobacteria bacterium]